MFQFSDDDDLNVEDLLNLPLEKSVSSNEDRPTKNSEPNDFDSILDDCDDNELILSAIDNIDNSITKEPVNQNIQNEHKKIMNIIEKTLQNDPSMDTRSISEKISNQSSIKKFISHDIKHKLPTPKPSVSKAPRVEYERKFPGPAGLIPKKSKSNTPVKTEEHTDGSPPVVESSHVQDTILECSTWVHLLKDVQSMSSKLQSIIDENTVASVKRMNIICSKPRKLQFFAAIIMQIDCSICDPSIVLKDSTGEIHGTLHKDLWENHSNLFTIGTALLLKQVSVLSITNSRKLYVNVTSNNIVKTYTPQPDNRPVLVTQLSTILDQDFVQQIKKNERVVFEETHPNRIPNNQLPKRSSWIKEVPTHKSPVLPALNQKTDTTKTAYNENKVPSCSIFKPKANQISPSVVSQSDLTDKKLQTSNSNSSQIQFRDLISNELEGIDADSLFGEF